MVLLQVGYVLPRAGGLGEPATRTGCMLAPRYQDTRGSWGRQPHNGSGCKWEAHSRVRAPTDTPEPLRARSRTQSHARDGARCTYGAMHKPCCVHAHAR